MVNFRPFFRLPCNAACFIIQIVNNKRLSNRYHYLLQTEDES